MSLNRNTSNCIQSGNSSSGKEKKKSRVPSFLLWFNHKENQSVHKDKLQQARYNIEHDIINELIKQINEDDAAVSRPVTPYNYPTIRRTGSCESLLSIATNGFNYIRPDIYLESTHSNGRETNRQSVISEQDHFKSNLPSDGYYSDNNDRFDSLSHARRKRRAPPPPNLTGIEMNRYSDQILVRSVESNAETTSSSSLGRKKRKAPQPPVSPPPTLSTSEPVVIQSSDSSTASVLPLPLRPWYKRRSALKKDKEKCSTEVGSNQDLMQDNYFVRDLKSALILNRESVSSYINTPSISELDRQAAEIIKDDYKDEPSCSAPPRVNRSKSPRATDAKLKFFNTENTCNVTSNGNTNMNALNDDVNLMWTCPYCTLDNPIWRIICGACERMKVTNDIGILTNGKTDIVPSKCLNEPDMPIARETDINITARSNENYVTPKEFITTSSIENPDLPNLTKLAKREVEKNQKIVTTSMVENPDVPNLSKLAKQEIRKHRLAHFGPKQVNDDKTPADQRSDLTKEAKLEALEREKLRLRQLIDKMNAAAIADKEPKPDIEQSNLNLNTSNHQRGAQSKENVMEIVVNKVLITDQTKNRLGAIKKQLNPKLNASNELKNKANVQETTNLNIVSNDSNQLNATTTKAIDKHGNLKLNDLNKINSVYEKINPTKNITVNNLTDPKISLNNRSLITVTETYVDNVKTVSSSANRNTTDDTRTKCDTLKIDSDLRKLEFCIKSGDYENAAKLAAKLAKQKVNLSVIKGEPKFKKLDNTESIQVADPSEIKVELTVENNDGILEREAIQISPLLTIQQLKKKFHNELKYPIDQQRLRINGTTAIDDSKILSEYCRDIDNSRVHVVLLTDKIFDDKGKLQRKRSITPTKAEDENFHIEDSDEEISESQNEAITNLDDILKGAEALPIEIDRDEWVCVLCTLINSKNRTCCAACSHVRPNQPIQNNKPITLDTKQSIVVKPSPILEQAAKSSNPNITRTKYRGVENFNPKHYKEYVVKDKETKEPVPNSDNESQIDPNFKLNIGNNHYMELVNLDSADIVPNIEEFECPICYLNIKKSDGVVLRDCLHSFCKDCLQGTVQHGEDAEISCPFRDNVYTCNSKLQEREIKAIVSKEIYDQHLARSLRQVEHQIKNAFHCKTPNCRGWCIYEDDVNRFKCPICKIVNCLTCRVIHDGLNCKQYQEQMDKNSENDIDAKNTMKMLQEMVDKGEAINCPICHVVLMKKWGCDWLKCSMCKTEICWVTRGPRWGPDGKGDTSGGCKCGVNGVKCHPKCNYCH